MYVSRQRVIPGDWSISRYCIFLEKSPNYFPVLNHFVQRFVSVFSRTASRCVRRGSGRNVSWMLFRDGRSSNHGLNRGVEQAVLTSNDSRRSEYKSLLQTEVEVNKKARTREARSLPCSPGVRLGWTMSEEGLICLKSWALPLWGENCVSNQGGYRSRVLTVSTHVPRVTVPRDKP